MNYDNLPQPPEGVLHPTLPWSRINPNSRLWLVLKSKLTGRRQGDEFYSSYVNLSDADADRLIANMKKDPRGYPSLDQESGTPLQWMERQEKYQRWLVEVYLENPFREEVNKKIEERQIESRLEEIQKTKKEIEEAETTEEVVDILEDKKEILEDIQEKISPPPNEYQRPADPWEGSYTTPETPKQEKKKPKRRKLKRPQGVVKKPKKKPASRKKKTPTPPPPESKRKRLGRMVGSGLKKAGGYIGKTMFSGGSGMGGGGGGENEGPSVLSAGAWLGKKVKKAFQDAKEEKERALEAQSNGAELAPETLEPGYFLKKSIGYQFGGRAFDTSFGAFIEKMPSKQSSSKAGFGDKFDYGDADPKKKKKKTNELRDLATGFRRVSTALGSINKQITKQTQTLSQLVTSSERNADLLEGISNALAGLVAVEIDSGSDEIQAQQASGGDVNIPSFDLSGLLGKGDGGLDWFDMLMAADDIRDLRKGLKDGKVKTTRRSSGKPKITGDVTPKRRFRMPSFGRRMKFSQGTAGVSTQVPALIGEAGPELLMRGGMQKLAEGGVMQGTGSNILATGLGAAGDLMKKVQPFANVMEMPFKVIGAQISGALASLVSAAGPFSGVIAKMFSPLLGGLATVFGLNQGAFAAEIESAAMTEEQGAKILAGFFAKFFKLFGFKTDAKTDESDDKTQTTATGDWGPLLDLIASGEGSYDSVNPSLKRPEILDMTIGQLKEWQIASKKKDGGTAAAGRYQIMYPESYANVAGMSLDEKFTPANQDKLASAYIEKRRKGKDWREGKISDEDFGYELAAEWAALKQPNGKGRYDGDGRNTAKIEWSKTKEALQKIKGNPTQAAKGVVKPTSFINQVQGVFEMTGPDSGYKVPEELTGGQPVVGHGLEWLIKMSNKFIILPGVNNEYDVFKNPEKTFERYEQIGNQGGVEVAGLVDFIDKMLFSSPKSGKPVRYQTGPRDAIEAIGGKYYAPYGPDSSFKPVRGAMLNNDMPEGNVMPLPIPTDTVSGTSAVAMVQTITPVIQQVPVYIKGDTEYINVPANPLVAAREKAKLAHYTAIT